MKITALNYTAIIVAIIGGFSGLISAFIPGLLPILFERDGYLAIETVPEIAQIEFISHDMEFKQGMALKSGIYQVNM